MRKAKKILLTIGIVLLSVVIVAGIAVFALWHNEIFSLTSIDMLVDANEENKSAPVYIMDVSGGYYFDEFIEQGGVSNDNDLIQFIVDNITKGIIPINIEAPDIGCSSFTGVDENGDRYFGRNYDFSTTTGMIVRTNPGDGRYASISSVDLQFLGITDGAPLDSLMQKFICLAAPYAPLDGINEAGVSCGIYMSYQGKEDDVVATNQTTDKPDLTSTTMLRMILDYAGSVDEAVELVKKYDLHDSANTSFHYMVADSTGKSAILEWVNATDDTDTDGTKRELKVYYNNDDAGLGEKETANKFQYITNFIVTPDYYENQDNMNGKSDKNTITVWSALYNLTDKTVTWVSNEEFDNPDAVLEFDFSYLD